ncbi:MAG: acyltransferase, partial [Melioribacteraceae bacterium]|nr:acyltransferase [Melioribacteraceae bacterium]
SLGRGSMIGIGVSLKQPKKVSIGKNCIIDDYVHISARGDHSSSINIEDKVFIGRSTELKLRNGIINISSNSSIGSCCRIATTDGKINIGEYVFLAAYCYIGGGNHKIDRTDIPIAEQGFESRGGVTIGDDVWIGANSIISDGVTIGKGSVIGACSLVNKDIPEYSIAFGSPAKVYKSRLEE